MHIEVCFFIVCNSFLQNRDINLDLFWKDKTQAARMIHMAIDLIDAITNKTEYGVKRIWCIYF